MTVSRAAAIHGATSASPDLSHVVKPTHFSYNGAIMKNIVLIKQHPCVQLGHLYEHLFLRAVNEFFYRQGLYKALDYAAHGTTFEEGGVITVDIELYSDEAVAQTSAIEQLHIDFGDENKNVLLALYQIGAEEEWTVGITDGQKVLDELILLDQQRWQSIDELTVIDTRTIRRKNPPIYLTVDRQPKPRKLHVSLKHDKELNALQAALFNSVSRVLLLTVTNKIVEQYGFYAGELRGTPSPLSVTSELLVFPILWKDIDIDEVLISAEKVLNQMITPTTIERIAHDVGVVDYLDHSRLAPDFERILNQTRVIVGAAGWNSIATPDEIGAILAGAELVIKKGRQTKEVTL